MTKGKTKGPFRPWLTSVIVWMHIMAFYALVWGVLHHGFSWAAWGWFIGFYTVRQVGVSLGNHRQFTHETFKCHFATKVVLAFCAGTSAEGLGKDWCAEHAQHHFDTEGPWDPHTPTMYPGWKGFWWAHIGWLFFEVNKPPTPDFDAMYARRNQRIMKWDRRMYPLALLSGFILPWYFSGTGALLLAGFFGVVSHWHGTWCVNSVCHIFGSTDKRFRRLNDASKNSKNNMILLALAWIGEAWHFYHHAKADSAFLGWKWYHLDLGKWILLSGEPFGIFWDIKRPPADA